MIRVSSEELEVDFKTHLHIYFATYLHVCALTARSYELPHPAYRLRNFEILTPVCSSLSLVASLRCIDSSAQGHPWGGASGKANARPTLRLARVKYECTILEPRAN